MSNLDVIIEDLTTHPQCVHGPTLLFSRREGSEKQCFYACSACRDRKKCPFFVWKHELDRYVNEKISKQIFEFQNSVHHRKLYLEYNKIKATSPDQRIYCHSCSILEFKKNSNKHEGHDIATDISNYLLEHPSELLKPLVNAKVEAQYLFSKDSVNTFVQILKELKYKNVICIGAPRIFEYLNNDIFYDINAILLDFDSRYHTFLGPLEFCWFNMFNNHFFKKEGKQVFDDFLESAKATDTILITDPPFGGRIEPIADTLRKIDAKFKAIHHTNENLPIFWVFPYFMESHIMNTMNNFCMLDYKVNYENHPLFQGKGRKHGSPIRIFTNLPASLIDLPPEEGYRYCDRCSKWVSEENKHCSKCGVCTSKDGRTYVHCKTCKKCVKPSWVHCSECNKCAQKDHQCGELLFTKNCFHCKETGHKKRDCPKVDHEELERKRKLGLKTKNTQMKKKKISVEISQ